CDCPFGETVPRKYPGGTSLLVALPPRSQRLWRLDLVLPLDRSTGANWELRVRGEHNTRIFWREPRGVLPLERPTGANWELRLRSENNPGIFWREPRDVERSREGSLPQRIFQ